MVRRKRADRSGLPDVPPAATTGTVGMVVADLVPPGIGRLRPSARCVLVFCFGEQAIGSAGDLAEPCHVVLRILPTHVDDRLTIPSPAMVVDMRDAISLSRAFVPFG